MGIRLSSKGIEFVKQYNLHNPDNLDLSDVECEEVPDTRGTSSAMYILPVGWIHDDGEPRFNWYLRNDEVRT